MTSRPRKGLNNSEQVTRLAAAAAAAAAAAGPAVSTVDAVVSQASTVFPVCFVFLIRSALLLCCGDTSQLT